MVRNARACAGVLRLVAARQVATACASERSSTEVSAQGLSATETVDLKPPSAADWGATDIENGTRGPEDDEGLTQYERRKQVCCHGMSQHELDACQCRPVPVH